MKFNLQVNTFLHFSITSVSDIVSESLLRRGDKVNPANEKSRSTEAEEGKLVLYPINIFFFTNGCLYKDFISK